MLHFYGLIFSIIFKFQNRFENGWHFPHLKQINKTKTDQSQAFLKLFSDEDEDRDRITVRSDDELRAMIQWVRNIFLNLKKVAH